MKIGFITYNNMDAFDFIAIYDLLARLKRQHPTLALDLEVCAQATQVTDQNGLNLIPTQVKPPLTGFDWVIIPGGPGADNLTQDPDFISWLQSSPSSCQKAAVGQGKRLWLAAGLSGEAAAALKVAPESSGALSLGLQIIGEIAGPKARAEIETSLGLDSTALGASTGVTFTSASIPARARIASVTRSTAETKIEIRLNLDGRGQHQISTGLGFFDHMLTHLAVHGLFDLTVKAEGDLHIDPHHTVEDVALALGQAFAQALGDRAGIVRAASFTMPMDETLAFAAVDFSGRPYAMIRAEWHSPSVGGLPTTLLQHFFESFAFTARCNLHAQILTGRDDHHQAEGLFKAWARALSAATRPEPRLAGAIPSTKGTLVA